MLGKPTADGKCRRGITNVEAQHNILNESFAQHETYQPESRYTSEKNIVVLKDYETDRTSKRNFFLIANNIPEHQIGQLGSRRASEKSASTASTAEKETLKLDTVRSGESLIKHFSFDTSKYNSDTNKCIAFWKTLMQTDLQPVKCTLLKGGASSMASNCNDVDEETSDQGNGSCMWYKALVELQRRKMDEAAFAAIPNRCNLCGHDEPYSNFKKKQGEHFSENELKDDEDVTCLNDWNPNGKQVVRKSIDDQQQQQQIQQHHPIQQQNETGDLFVMTEQPTLPSAITSVDRLSIANTRLSNTDNASILDQQQSVSEEICGTHEHGHGHGHGIITVHSDPCKCGRTTCVCNEWDGVSENSSTKSSDSEPCKCGRRECLCNEGDENSQELEVINFPEFQEKEGTSKTSTKQVEKSNRSGDGKNIPQRVLPKCEICKTDCNCWEHKIEMSKQFIDESRFKLKYGEAKQDKACETEEEDKEKVEQLMKFCIICGHHDCNCDGPQQKRNLKYLKHLEFDDNTISTLLIHKEKSLKAIKSLTCAEKISTSSLQKKLLEHNKLDVCCTKETDKLEDNKQDETVAMNKVMNTKKLSPKKIYITPEQRAKNITHRTIVGRGKFGIPQLMRYADGRFTPKPAKSQDILSTESSDHTHG